MCVCRRRAGTPTEIASTTECPRQGAASRGMTTRCWMSPVRVRPIPPRISDGPTLPDGRGTDMSREATRAPSARRGILPPSTPAAASASTGPPARTSTATVRERPAAGYPPRHGDRPAAGHAPGTPRRFRPGRPARRSGPPARSSTATVRERPAAGYPPRHGDRPRGWPRARRYSAITPAAASASTGPPARTSTATVRERPAAGYPPRHGDRPAAGHAPRALLGDYARGGERIDRAASQDQHRDREGASRRRTSSTPRGRAPSTPPP